MARRCAGKIASVAFDPTFIIDRTDPELAKRWPGGFMGWFWRVLTILLAKPPPVAGEPIADLMFADPIEGALNGALFQLGERKSNTDRAMSDRKLGQRLWHELEMLTQRSES